MTLSYRTQINRAREIAELALKRFPLRNPKLHFINHGENTTYRVLSGGKQYLLRLHRHGYHSLGALQEEIAWLKRLSRVKEISVPNPVRSKTGKNLELVKTEHTPEGRYCDVFEWVHGNFARSNVSSENIYKLGALLAMLQKHSVGQKVLHRRYWDARGLVGPSGKFGSIDHLVGINSKDQKVITNARKLIFKKLLAFERRFPERQSLIHADLHFGNFVIKKNGELGAIDFDDSGFGFHAYDLAVPVSQLGGMCKKNPKRLAQLTDAIQEGYASVSRWDEHDREILPHLVTARRLVMLGWLNTRSDNPRLKKILPGAVKRTLQHLKKQKIK